MDTITCPFCGKETSASAETCEHCAQPLNELAQAAETLTEKNTTELEATLPDWLKEARQGEQADEQETKVEEVEAEEDVDPLAWLDGLDAEDDEEENADWLISLQEETLAASPQEQDAATTEETAQVDEDAELAGIARISVEGDLQEDEIAQGELSEWISDLQGEAAAEELETLPDLFGEEKPQPETENLLAEGDLPDWLSAGKDGDAAVQDELPAADELPDWMKTESTAEAAEKLGAAVASEAADELPEWLSGSETEVSGAQAEEAETASDLPDWVSKLRPAEGTFEESLKEIASAEEIEKEDVSFAEEVFGEQAGAQESAFAAHPVEDAAEAEVPAWLSQVEQGQVELPAEEDKEEAASAETPAWLDELPSVKVDAEEAEEPEAVEKADAFVDGVVDTDEIFGIEMPDWLSSLSPEDAAEEHAPAEEKAETAEVSGVELPSWVQAMRPVEDVVSDASQDAEDSVAGTGPLAGLNGVLPPATGLGQISKPKAHSIRLHVSESQKNGVAMLEELLAGEAKPVAQPKSSRVSSIPLVRWGIALLLFLTVGFSLFSRSETVALPTQNVAEVQAAQNKIDRLAAGETVLLVFDYEAGFSGEMKAAAAPLVEQLLARGEKITVLSTLPLGARLAENFLAETQAKYEFRTGVNYRNLGYLPGGASGIVGFVADPRQAVSLRDENSDLSVWDVAPLDTVQRFSDFALVVILTDDAERGRTWIEQVSQPLEESDSPLIMAVSAQAEPMIYPYYASGQLDGLVSGLSGGASYEQLQKQSGLGRKYWDAYGIGLLLAEILIAVGAIVNFLAALNARRKEQKEEN
jgi:hypothetical protein